jgi:hypothetical protein
MPEPVITGAQNALSGMGMDAATALRSLLMDPQQQVRFAALQVYRLMHPLPPDALPFLVPVLSDSHPTLRNNAIELLHGQGPTGYEILERAGIAPTGNAAPTISAHASFGELIMHLDSTDPVTRAQACAMLNQHTDYPQAAPLLQKAVISDPDPPVRRCAITGLIARAKWNEALSETYRQALLDTDSEVRAEACRAFQRAPLLSPAVIEDLFTFFEKDRAIALSSTTYRGSYVAARDALMRHATPETRARLESIERTAIPIGISQPSAVNTATPSPVSPCQCVDSVFSTALAGSRAKDKMLADKRHQSEKKQNRHFRGNWE